MLRIAVTGASGYMGAELLRLLTVHPKVRISAVTSERLAGERLDRVYPHLRGLSDLVFQEIHGERLADEADVVFLALPHMESQRLMPTLRRHGKKAIDLSADYRLKDATLYTTWYKAPHEDASGLAEAVYGLPEIHGYAVSRARLVGNPGCYPTCVILGLAPLVHNKLIQLDSIVADCKSGASGAGRQTSLATQYCEVNEGLRAYKVAEHRHNPEMDQELSRLAGEPVSITFSPHLVPMSRGILGTLYARLVRPYTEMELLNFFQNFYDGQPFIRLHPVGSLPNTGHVRGSNYCDLGVRVDAPRSRVIVVSAIDNLARGAASQAVHNFNLMSGFPETLGLEAVPFLP